MTLDNNLVLAGGQELVIRREEKLPEPNREFSCVVLLPAECAVLLRVDVGEAMATGECGVGSCPVRAWWESLDVPYGADSAQLLRVAEKSH